MPQRSATPRPARFTRQFMLDVCFLLSLTICLMEMRFPRNSSHSPQGVLRLNGRELLFGEAKRLVGKKFTPLANLCNRRGITVRCDVIPHRWLEPVERLCERLLASMVGVTSQ